MPKRIRDRRQRSSAGRQGKARQREKEMGKRQGKQDQVPPIQNSLTTGQLFDRLPEAQKKSGGSEVDSCKLQGGDPASPKAITTLSSPISNSAFCLCNFVENLTHHAKEIYFLGY